MPNTMDSPVGMSASELQELQRLFLDEGIERIRELLTGLDQRLDAAPLARRLREWAVSAAQLGYYPITDLAQSVEPLLGEVPIRIGELRRRLSDLLLGFCEQRDQRSGSVPNHVALALSAKRIAVVGLPAEQADHVCTALGRVNARPRLFSALDQLQSEPIRECDLVVVHVGPETDGAKLQAAVQGPLTGKLILAGEHRDLMALPSEVQSQVAEYLADDWQPGELLLRLTLATLRKVAAVAAPVTVSGVAPESAATAAAQTIENPRVLIVDDDHIVLSLLRTTLRNFGMQCETVDNGSDALRLIRSERPQVVVLDVNMPGLDGYGVLSTVRTEQLPTLVVLVTARQQEHDVLRGFQLGADDYLVKPFNPPELVARIKRLLRQPVRVAA
jgi:CheY-like chemotaxis protein